ncbi:protein teflon [Drosophila grimshawi]|uniref:protein teflon n=1 Tax=Drosophila grimshawi TaxID=7222 RepID=UPI000C86EBE7|nr:protein teflon [Drosophila grimshawi]
MSSILNPMSNSCVNYEKCGDVIVSPKNNVIKMYCNFCSDLFENLVEFLHHLQWMHNDVLGFDKPYNVYNIEQLLPQTDAAEDLESQAESSSSSDSGIPSNTSYELEPETKSSQARNKNILDALAAYDVDYKKGKESVMQWQANDTGTKDGDVVAEVVAMLLKDDQSVEATQTQLEDNTDDGLELQKLQQAAGLQSIEVRNEQSQSANYLNDKPQIKDTTPLKPTNQKAATNLKRFRHRWEMAAKMKTEKPQSICNLKSYAIARSARKRVQQQQMSNIKKRILRSLENEPRKPIDRVCLDNICAEMKMLLPNGKILPTAKNSIMQEMHTASNMKTETNQFSKVKSIAEQNNTKENQSKELKYSIAVKAIPAANILFKPENEVVIMRPSSSMYLSAAQPKPITEIEKKKINMITDCNMVSTSQKIPLPSIRQPKKTDFSQGEANPSHIMVKNVIDTKNSIEKHCPKSPIIINKVEILPTIRVNLINTQTEMKVETSQSKDNEKRVRRSSCTIVNSLPMLTKKPTRRPSFHQVAFKREPLKPETEPCPKQSKKRKGAIINNNSNASLDAVDTKRTKTEQNSLNFDLSDSVMAFLQSDLETTQLDADSLWELAETSEKRNRDSFEKILNQVKGEQKTDLNAAPTNLAIESETKAVPNNILRADFSLLQVVGLPIIKDSQYEDRKPIETSDLLRTRAVKFSKMLRSYNSVWNPKSCRSQFTEKSRSELSMLTADANREFGSNLSESELKRILNLIHAWHAQQIDLKFFKKVTLPSTIDHYLQLFGYLPKMNHYLYYCEWCEESSCSKLRYERHRQTHLCDFTCPHCNRIFKKKGFMVNHARLVHNKEM